MKKFLSLVLALIMTMSLVTIGASAAEYDDFTDKDEIKYEEAVAVLNKLGIITGYSEGDFRPEGELTRGAAAKIIVSLLIGPEAANNVSPTSAPYSDVPLDHTFAGPIAYCKTAGIINGYSDGSFHPGDTLTGYAFSKMLLGALGYDGAVEGFTGSGWNMNVNARAAEAGLFDRISFKGNDPVNREEACQLALNTLKATMVEYTGGFTVSAGDAQVVGAQNRSYKTSNQEYASHINNRKAGGELGTAANALYTVEFGEEHFVDLRMDSDRDAKDDFGRVSNKWSYKKVTIGTYPIEPDFSYDKQVSHVEDTDGAKRRATELGDYRVAPSTKVWLNGYLSDITLAGVEDIADLTDNGTVVEVYVSDETADLITDVVVIQTQLMEIKRIGGDYVSLQMYDNGKSDNSARTITVNKVDKTVGQAGYNQPALNLKVEDVQEEDSTYKLLSGLKAGDIVAVIPVAIDHTDKYDVGEAYVPETVTGALTGVKDYGKTGSTSSAISITVGGSVYNIANWSKDLLDITGEKIKVTRKDVTLYLDKAGNAMLGKDVGATNDWMIVGNFRQTLVGNEINWVVNGWDISGTELSLNVGPTKPDSHIVEGDLVKYTSDGSGKADWKLEWNEEDGGVYTVYTGTDTLGTNAPYAIKSSNDKVALDLYDGTNHAFNNSGVLGTDYGKEYLDKGAKFIYVRYDSESGEVESIDVRSDVQNVTNPELKQTVLGEATTDTGVLQQAKNQHDRAQAALKVDSKDSSKNVVKAVVIKTESSDAAATNMLYIRDYISGADKEDASGKIVYGYTVAMLTKDGFEDNKTIYSYKRLSKGDFASYVESTNDTFSPFYELSGKNDRVGKTTSVFYAEVNDGVSDTLRRQNKNLLAVKAVGKVQAPHTGLTAQICVDANSQLGVGNGNDTVNLRNAKFVDLVTSNNSIDSVDDLANYKEAKIALIVNDDPTKDNFRRVDMIVILDAKPKTDDALTPAVTVSANAGTTTNDGNGKLATVSVGRDAALTLTASPAPGASGYGTLTYQWYAGTTEIPGATSYQYTVPTGTPGTVSYSVKVTNTDNSKENEKTAEATSAPAVAVTVTNEVEGAVKLTVTLDKTVAAVVYKVGNGAEQRVFRGAGETFTFDIANVTAADDVEIVSITAANGADVDTNWTPEFTGALGSSVVPVGSSYFLPAGSVTDANKALTIGIPVKTYTLKVTSATVTNYTLTKATVGEGTDDVQSALTGATGVTGAKGTKVVLTYTASTAGTVAAPTTITAPSATSPAAIAIANAENGVNSAFTQVTVASDSDITTWKANNPTKTLYTHATAVPSAGAQEDLSAVTGASVAGDTYTAGSVYFTIDNFATKATFQIEITIGTADWTIASFTVA